MANAEQLAVLKQGVEAWNEWRQQNPHIAMDLSKANLREANLRADHLFKGGSSSLNLREANLIEAVSMEAGCVRLISAELSLILSNSWKGYLACPFSAKWLLIGRD